MRCVAGVVAVWTLFAAADLDAQVPPGTGARAPAAPAVHAQTLDEIVARIANSNVVVLVIDQFEEVFTLCHDELRVSKKRSTMQSMTGNKDI